jgi:hypothetical protein
VSNDSVGTAIRLIEATLAGGDESAMHFREFLQFLLSRTIMKDTSFLKVQQRNDRFIISGPNYSNEQIATAKPKELLRSLKLNDGHYLYLFYEAALDRTDHDYLKIQLTKMSYHLDEWGREQLFRFDHLRKAPNKYPFSHLHVYGTWMHGYSGKELKSVHFPVIRPTVEGIIRLLIDEFGVPCSLPDKEWREMLDQSEQKFVEVMSKRSK